MVTLLDYEPHTFETICGSLHEIVGGATREGPIDYEQPVIDMNIDCGVSAVQIYGSVENGCFVDDGYP